MPKRGVVFTAALVIAAVGAAGAGLLAALTPGPDAPVLLTASYVAGNATGNEASITWTLGNEVVLVRDSTFQPRPSFAARLNLVSPSFPGSGTQGTIFVDAETGLDVAGVLQCTFEARRLSCKQDLESAEWGSGSSITFFGSLLLPSLDWGEGTATLEIGGVRRAFAVTSEREGLLLSPLGQEARTAFSCNLLDDEVLVDPTRSFIKECRHRESEQGVFRLVGPPPRLPAVAPLSAAGATSSPFGQPRAYVDVLPPGAEFRLSPEEVSIREAYDGARGASPTFIQWMDRNPSAILHSSQPAGLDETETASTLRVRETRLELRFVTDAGEGYALTVARREQTLLGNEVRKEYVVLEEGPWTPEGWSAVPPVRPPRAIPLGEAVPAIERVLPALTLSQFRVELGPLGGGPNQYVVSVASQSACKPGTACAMSTILLELGSGTLVNVVLPPDVLESVLFAEA